MEDLEINEEIIKKSEGEESAEVEEVDEECDGDVDEEHQGSLLGKAIVGVSSNVVSSVLYPNEEKNSFLENYISLIIRVVKRFLAILENIEEIFKYAYATISESIMLILEKLQIITHN